MGNSLSPALKAELERGIAKQRAGASAEAEKIFRAILARQPDCADAWNLLGVVEFQRGAVDRAIEDGTRAVSLEPAIASYHLNLGSYCLRARRYAEALGYWDRAIALDPKSAVAHVCRGETLLWQNRHADAAHALTEALRLEPKNVDALRTLGMVKQSAQDLTGAIELYRKALLLAPKSVELLKLLAMALDGTGQSSEAVPLLERAISLDDKQAALPYCLGTILARLKRSADAVAQLKRAIALDPKFSSAYVNLGHLLADEGSGYLYAAEECFRKALELEPNAPGGHNNLGAILSAERRYDEAIAHFRAALKLQPDFASCHSNLLLTMHYPEGISPEEMFREHLAFAELQTRSLPGEHAYPQSRDPERRLRIGYVSADFRHHSVAWFLEPILRAHDRDAFEIYAYADVRAPDAVSERMSKQVTVWRNVFGMSDEQLTAQIAEDRIDVLVDLAGHAGFNRLRVFARKPAPVQVTYLGYPDTTGLSTIDLRITDAWADPPGQTERFHAETLARLPHGFLAYGPLGGAESPPVRELPARNNGYVTFGSFNALVKVTPALLSLWAQILLRVPRSRLMLKAKVFTNSPEMRERVLGELAACGVERERIELAGIIPSPSAHLDLYNRIDIGLDTFPYHGTTTTCEAMWMGVPVVSLAGRTHVSRVGVSLLTQVGLAELVATTREEYVAKAVALASDLDRLGALRAGLRERMASSSLTDGKRLTRELESVFRDAWRTFCAAGDAPGLAPTQRFARMNPNILVRVERGSRTEYLLDEQGDSGEIEQRFVSTLLEPGQVAVDECIDLYTLTMAASVGASGRVYAPGDEWLEACARRNHFAQLVEGRPATADLIRLRADPTELPTGVVAMFDPGRAALVRERGLELYRLVPGLSVLAPHQPGDPVDPFTRYLFACGPERAEQLTARGLLGREATSFGRRPRAWQRHLEPLVYAKRLADRFGAPPPDFPAYEQALDAYATARDSAAPLSLRLRALREALDALSRAVAANATLPRVMTLARVAQELGFRRQAVQALDVLLAGFQSSARLSIEEPFVPVAAEFDYIDPGADPGAWCLAQLLIERERLGAVSSYDTRAESANLLGLAEKLGFLTPAARRRLELLRRLGTL